MRASILLMIIMLCFSCEKEEQFGINFYDCDEQSKSKNHPDNERFQELIEEIASSGVPGIMMTIRNSNGVWSGATGKADLANNVDLLPCNITRVGSTVKTFTAVTIMLLHEEGKLDLDDQISEYLPASYLEGLENTDKATVRQLLQHSSGIYNYIVNLQFQTASLNDLTKTWKKEELLAYARGQKALFAPGTDVQYSNTNYILLGDIIEQVTGKKYYEVFAEKIFVPYELYATDCAAENPVPEGIVRGYVDFYSNLNVINSTYYSGWDYFTADGGLISNSADLNTFLNELFHGNILSQNSLKEMTNWIAPNEQDEEEYETFYGLGIFKINTAFGPAYIHSGDAIGYFASMVYFPEKDITISWAVNGNYGSIDEYASSKTAMDKIFQAVFEE
ncbi:serine hydrolase domain-containing protein [Chondrinema litorale]|uniref:serine hydrolase domain-containing protein n=1 Tax=Chondrinema litorale TaxID=2994555 RepID=UPI002543C9A0|nr:serine hydrolase domain-containing protein [Chondrinema litorale]UZR98302.1 serine hydrolase [Chondrinema litorale]